MVFRLTSVVLGIAAAGALIGALLFGARPEAQEPATPKDDVTPAELQLYIDVMTEAVEGGFVAVRVTDQGVGIPKQELKR
jgi:signal transduction histidine kinase